MIFGASVLNYVDRQALSILAPTIQGNLKLDDEGYALIVNLFLVAYTLSYLFSGRIVDRLGVRASFAFFVGWWSVANVLTAFARSLGSLGAFRFMLGLGEAGNWTAAPKAVAGWFAPRERGFAIGLYTLGASLGATVAPLLVVKLAGWGGWQAAFVATGALGLLWLGPWLWLYRSPPATTPTISAPAKAESWRTVLARREVWLLMLARLLTDPVWYFYQFWFAKYLHDARGLSQSALTVTWVIFLAADLGTLGGGWFSGLLIQRNLAPAASRLRIMLGCACLVPLSVLVPHAAALPLALACGMVVVFAHLAWLTNLSALVLDLIPQRSLATTFGIVAAGSSVGGIAMNWGVGRLVTNFSYTPAFAIMACLHPLALALLWPLRRKGEPAS